MSVSIITAVSATLTDTASSPGLISQLNTALAPLLSDNIRGVSFVTQGDERLLNSELQVAITYDTNGAVITHPYLAVGFQEKSIEAVQTSMQAFLNAHPSYFFSSVWIQAISQPRFASQYIGLLFYNTSAVDGAANWAVNGGGTLSGNILTGQEVWVDATFGNNATGVRQNDQKPFQTIQAAINAAVAGDVVMVREGTYVQGLTLKDRVGINLLEGSVLSPDAVGNILFQDGGAVVNTVIGGEGRLLSAQGGDILMQLQAASNVVVRCRECVFSNTAARGLWITAAATLFLYVDGLAQFDGDAATITAAAHVHMRAGQISIGSVGNGFNLTGSADVRIESDLIQTAAQVIYAAGACSAYVSAWQMIATGTANIAFVAGDGGSLRFECDEVTSANGDMFRFDGGMPAALSVRARKVSAASARVTYVNADGTTDVSFECETIFGKMEFGGNSPNGSIRVRAKQHSAADDNCFYCHFLSTFWLDIDNLFVAGNTQVAAILIGSNGEASTMHIAGGRIATTAAGGATSAAIDIYSTMHLVFDGATTLVAGASATKAINVVDAAPVNVNFNAFVTMNAPLDGFITPIAQAVTQPSLALGVTTLVDAATILTNAALAQIFDVTITADRTMAAPTNPAKGARITYRVRQGMGGNHLIAWDPVFRFSTSSPAPTLSTTAGQTDYVNFLWNEIDATWDGLAANTGFGP